MEELNKPMYFNSKPETFEAARYHRKHQTESETILWERLKGKKILGFKFRRQHPIDFFIADFYCNEVRLVIEVDGEYHTYNQDYDEARSQDMARYGIEVLRFTNDEVKFKLDEVLIQIEKKVTELKSRDG